MQADTVLRRTTRKLTSTVITPILAELLAIGAGDPYELLPLLHTPQPNQAVTSPVQQPDEEESEKSLEVILSTPRDILL